MGEHVDTAVHVGVTWELVAGHPAPGSRPRRGADAVPRGEPPRAGRRRALGRNPPLRLAQPVRRHSLGPRPRPRAAGGRARPRARTVGAGARRFPASRRRPVLRSGSPARLRVLGLEAGRQLRRGVFYANSIAPAITLGSRGARCARARASAARVAAGWSSPPSSAPGWAASRRSPGPSCSSLSPSRGGSVASGARFSCRGSRRRSRSRCSRSARARRAAPTGVQVELLPFAPANPARLAFGLPEVARAPCCVSGLLWLVLSLGPRLSASPGRWRALAGGSAAAGVLGAFALLGWPIATFVRITADPAYDESFYFVQASGLALWLFAVPYVARPREVAPAGARPHRAPRSFHRRWSSSFGRPVKLRSGSRPRRSAP